MHRVIIIPFGPPGVGKGTQAKLLSEKLGIPHISSGDLFRDNIKNETPIGKAVKDLLEKGQLVSDEIVIQMIEDRIAQPDCNKGLILDGMPRTLKQAHSLEALWKPEDHVHILELSLSDEEALQRICGRLICPNCGASYHETLYPPKVANICDHCGTKLTKRSDDTEATVRDRLALYHKETAPLTSFYADRLEKIDCTPPIAEIQKQILKKINT